MFLLQEPDTFPQSTIAGIGIRTVVATRIATDTGNGSDQLVFAATQLIHTTGPTPRGGLYFSADSGDNWNRLSGTSGFPNDGCTGVVNDPGDPTGTTFFAAFPNTGVFRFTVRAAGARVVNFTSTTNPASPPDNITTNLLNSPGSLVPATIAVDRIRLAASPVPLTGGGADRPVYASLYNFNTNGTVGLFGVFQFNPGTNTWKAMGRPPAPNTQA